MLSEVRLIIGAKEARLILKKNDSDVLEDELWTFDRKVASSEAQQIARCLFDDAYQMMQYAIHGDG